MFMITRVKVEQNQFPDNKHKTFGSIIIIWLMSVLF